MELARPNTAPPVARAGLALLLANARYWSTVAPVVRGELRRWERRAQTIDDDELRALALGKLQGESFHAEAAAMLATLAPRANRKDAVQAIVALELLFDYLDGLTERPTADPLRDGERLFEAYVEAVTVGGVAGHSESARANDNGYLEALSDTARTALAKLPATGAITRTARASAIRSAQAQIRMHAVPQLGVAQVEQWARSETDGTGLQWRELLAGAASSVLAIHALVAAAADPSTTVEQAEKIERAYLSSCVLLTLLDGIIDHEQDTRQENARGPSSGTPDSDSVGSDSVGLDGVGSDALGSGGLGYIGLYADRDELSTTLTAAATRAVSRAGALDDGPHHTMTLVGVVAYYTSAPGARSELAAPIARSLRDQFAPLSLPTLAFMHAWRLAKRVGNRRAPWTGGLGSSKRVMQRQGRVQ